MADLNSREKGRELGFLARHRKALLAGVVSFAIIGGGAGVIIAPLESMAATVPSATATFASPPSFADVIQNVTPAVVSVKVQLSEAPQQMMQSEGDDNGGGMAPNSPFEKFFRQFGEGQMQGGTIPQNQVVRAQGSGFFVSSDGYIMTNNHVVDHATHVDVVTSDGKTLTAKVIGTDPQTDLALIKVDGKDFPYVHFAAQPPRIGDWVIAMGNPFGLGETATAGIVSAKGRDIGEGPYDNFMQIDAPVNRGNSGGPTFDAGGEVVGMNTAIYSPSGGSVGIGFDIPADTVQSVYSELKSDGHITRGAIGVEVQPLTQDLASALGMIDMRGAVVDQAQPDSPAAKAGLKSGDVITQLNGTPIVDAHDLSRRINVMAPGTNVTLTYLRDGATKTASMTLETLPGTQTAQASTPNGGDNSLPQLGMQIAPSSRQGNGTPGVVVENVDPSGIAASQGIRSGDVILNVDGKSVATPSEFRSQLAAAKADHKKMALLRVASSDGQTHFVAVPVA